MKIITLTYPFTDKIYEQINNKFSLAIGNFDGVHKGHQQVINEAKRIAAEKQLLSAVMTFEPSPKSFFSTNEDYKKSITPIAYKLSLFEELEVDYVFVVNFNVEFSQITPDQFIHDVLTKLSINQVVVGFDFRFGKGGQGDVSQLKLLASDSLDVHIVEPYILNGEKVSSTSIRSALEIGDMDKAKDLLGRYFELSGDVIGGDKRGRTIGFPTANMRLSESFVVPKLGVYAVNVYWNNKKYKGVLNFGLKPTFKTGETVPVMEVHIVDFDQQIYGELLTLEWVKFIRPEMKFNGINELVEQINKDKAYAIEILSSLDEDSTN